MVRWFFFYAEAGAITPSTCQTVDGSCSVTWFSSDPRPGEGASSVGDADGVAQIMAYTDGAESFIDTNDNGAYDSGEVFGDLDDLYADEFENGMYDSGERLARENADVYRGSDSQYNGPLCNSGCSSESTIKIGVSLTLVLSGSNAFIIDLGDTPDPNDLVDVSGEPSVFGLSFGDTNGNSLPAGTTISIETANGEIEGETNYEILNNTTLPKTIGFNVKADDTPGETDRLVIKIETPRGIITTFGWTIKD
jgi:hypothetical protein